MERVNLHVLSANSLIAEGIRILLKPEDISLSGYSKNFGSTLKYLPKKNPRILFVDDHSFEEDKLLNFLNILPKSFPLTKTIIYTENIDITYLNSLTLSKVNGILHKTETQLSSISNPILKINPDWQARKKFNDAIKSVYDGYFIFDRIIYSILHKSRHAWAKGSEDYGLFLSQGKQYENVAKYSGMKFNDNVLWDESTYKQINQLSYRELEILKLISERMRNGEIADALFISRRTVEKHISNFINKLKISSDELKLFAILNKEKITYLYLMKKK